jgi:SAM-dependent methyltransferase
VTDEEGYLLDNRQSEAGERLRALSELFDPSTFRHIERLGIARGWHCWELGAGGPTVAAWLAGRVGVEGSVLATDIDLSWMVGPGPRTYEVRHHDVGAEAPPPGPFDLIHARLVLVHVPRRAEVVAELVEVLRPGGWLLVEDADKIRRGVRALLTGRGADLAYGRTLPRVLRQGGLVEVEADAYFPITSPACTVLERATVEQTRDRLVSDGIATRDEVDRHLATLATGALDVATSPMISAWGRKPDEA